MTGPRRHRIPRGALAALRDADADLSRVIDRVGPCRIAGYARNDLEALVRAIVYQQLSGKAAATIYGRFLAGFPGGRYPSARAILVQPEEAFRAAGISRAKEAAIRDLCEHVTSRRLRFGQFSGASDEEIVASLTRVRGIGRWSAQMFLMFHMGRMDVWPAADLGVRKGIQKLRRRRKLPDMKAMEREGRRFAPHRTIAAWYMWRSLEIDVDL